MNKQEINYYFDNISPTEEQRQKMLDNIIKSKQKKSYKLPILIAVATIFISTAAFGANFGWHQKMIDYLNPNKILIEDIENIDVSNAKISDSGVTLAVQQIAVTMNDIYVLYELKVPDYIELNDDAIFSVNLDIVSEDYNSFAGGIVSNGGIRKLVGISKDKHTLTAIISQTQSNPIGEGYGVLSFYGLDKVFYDNDGKYVNSEPMIKTDINFRFNLKPNSKNTITIMPNKVLNIGKYPKWVNRIVITPFSVYINVLGNDFIMRAQPSIKFKDGSEIIFNVNSENKSFSYSTYNGNNFMYSFENVIDPSEIESITIGDVHMSGSLTIYPDEYANLY